MKPVLVCDYFKNDYSSLFEQVGIPFEVAHSVDGANRRLTEDPEGFSLLLIDPVSHFEGCQDSLRALTASAMKKMPVMFYTTLGPKLLEEEMEMLLGTHYVALLKKEEPENTKNFKGAIMLYAK
ncbi:hypothetical protein JXB27_03890 [Candidatus Woesearchaeota archaeon]|nr:hypothetical protein [Candidatus Woesearchaeota archaeon]